MPARLRTRDATVPIVVVEREGIVPTRRCGSGARPGGRRRRADDGLERRALAPGEDALERVRLTAVDGAAAAVAIGIYLAQLIAGNVALGAPGSGYRTACMTTLIAGLGAWAWSWVHSPPVGPSAPVAAPVREGGHASRQERHAQCAWILLGAHAPPTAPRPTRGHHRIAHTANLACRPPGQGASPGMTLHWNGEPNHAGWDRSSHVVEPTTHCGRLAVVEAEIRVSTSTTRRLQKSPSRRRTAVTPTHNVTSRSASATDGMGSSETSEKHSRGSDAPRSRGTVRRSIRSGHGTTSGTESPKTPARPSGCTRLQRRRTTSKRSRRWFRWGLPDQPRYGPVPLRRLRPHPGVILALGRLKGEPGARTA